MKDNKHDAANVDDEFEEDDDDINDEFLVVNTLVHKKF